MGERTSYPHGTFSWVDLATTDQDAAKSFFSELFGWDYEDSPVGDGVFYSMARVDGRYVAAIAPQQQQERDMGVPPHWNSYVTVDDVDAAAGRVAELGGQLVAPPFDVTEAGRMAVLADPSGAYVCLWQAKAHPGAGLVNAPGALCWNELATRDPQAAMDFYAALLGWTFNDFATGGGPRYWVIMNGERSNGGVREMGDETPAQVPSHWLAYFAVADIAATFSRASERGAQPMLPPTEIGPGTVAAFADPQGAVVGLYGGQLDD